MISFLLLAPVICLVMGPDTHSKLELQNIQATYGPFWPERKTLDFYPEDLIYFRYYLCGLKATEEGIVEINTTIELTNTDHKVVLFKTMPPVNYNLAVGDGRILCNASTPLSNDVPPGEYLMKVVVKDKVTSYEASFSRKIRVKPFEFAVMAIRFFHDSEHKIPASNVVHAAEQMHGELLLAGFARNGDKPNIATSIQLLNAQGQELLPKPFIIDTDSFDPTNLRGSVLFLNLGLVLNTPGDYTARFTVTDRIANKTIKVETPISAVGP